MPRYVGPKLVVETPAGRVWEPLRSEDVCAQVARMAEAFRWQPDAVWHVEPERGGR